MNIKVFNMAFGESILLENENERLLVDCGSEKTKDLEDRLDIIKNQLTGHKKISFMITHFHDDHYNGFQKAYKDKKLDFPKASKIYLPWVFMENNKAPILLSEAIYLYMLYKRNDESRSPKFWLGKQIEFILNSSNEDCVIQLLKEECRFNIGQEEMEVLWPGILNFDESPNPSLSIAENIFNFVDNSIPPEEVDKFKKAKEFLLDSIMKFYRVIENAHNNNGDLKVKGVPVKEHRALFENILEIQIQNLRELDRIKNKIQWDDNSREIYKNKLKEIFRGGNNAYSIVFRDYKENTKNDVMMLYDILMTGDITPSIIEIYLSNNYFENTSYKYLKCPHHGTKTYYTSKLPPGDNLILSNGGGCESYHKISSFYFYHGGRISRKYCTNPRCEIYPRCKYLDAASDSSCEVDRFYSIVIS